MNLALYQDSGFSSDLRQSVVDAIIELSGDGLIRSIDNKFSVFDVIERVAGKKNAREAYSDVKTKIPEVVGKIDNFKFPGQGQRLTPCTDMETLLWIVMELPGDLPTKMRRLGAKAIAEIVKQEAIDDPVITPGASNILAIMGSIQQLAKVCEQLLEQERQIVQINQDVQEIKRSRDAAIAELTALPVSTDDCAQLNTRAKINMLVRNYCDRYSVPHHTIWDSLYKELYYRYRYSVQARCKKSGKKKLDQIEADDRMKDLYDLASSMLIQSASGA